jgi:MFS family permease
MMQQPILSTQRRWLILALVLIPVFIGALDLTIVSAILPEMLTRLNIPLESNLGTAAWTVSGYLLAYTVSMIIMGRVSDLIGRRNVYLVCLAIFIFGSYWVATAHEWPTSLFNQFARQVFHERPDTSQLVLLAVIAGRIIQALGAGAIVPVSLALVGDLFPAERRAQPVGIIGAVDTMGWVLGHLYGLGTCTAVSWSVISTSMVRLSDRDCSKSG